MTDGRARISWLHVSDLHVSKNDVVNTRLRRTGGALWAHGLREFFDDLDEQLERLAMVPDLLLITGDLVFSGGEQEYRDFDSDFLKPLTKRLEARGGEPLLLAVPGNHDILRPKGLHDKVAFELLRRYEDEREPLVAELRKALWRAQDGNFVAPLFSPYSEWMTRALWQPLEKPEARKTGLRLVWHRRSPLIPGDVAVIVEKEGMTLLLVGLNSAWLQFDGGDFKGKLHVPAEQLHAALDDDDHAALQRFESVDDALLLMHHPPDWLSPAALVDFERLVHPADRKQFSALLFGHMHEGRSKAESVDGGAPRYSYQSPSLFGYEHYGASTLRLDIGYSLGAIYDDGEIRVWPRVVPRDAHGLFFDVAPIRNRAADGSVRIRPPKRERPPLPAQPWKAPKDTSPRSFERYLRWAKERHCKVSLLGIGAERLLFQLDEIYVELGIEAPPPEIGTRVRTAPDDIMIAEAFRVAGEKRALFLKGHPGTGKTTALRKLLQLVVDHGSEAVSLPPGKLPVLLSLRHLRPEDLEQDQPLHRLLRSELTERGKQTAALADQLWERGDLLLLLDGLDEIADDGLRTAALAMITDSLDDLHVGGSRCAVSSRPEGLTKQMRIDGSYQLLEVRPLDERRRAAMIRQWFRATCRQLGRPDAEDLSGDLISRIENDRLLSHQQQELVATPLFVNLLCIVAMEGEELPKRRTAFFRKCLAALLEHRDREKGGRAPLPVEQALETLQRVALELHSSHRRDDMCFAELAAWSAPRLDEPASHTLLDWLCKRAGLLVEYADDRYGFAHLGFQEYLAAVRIREQAGPHLAELAGHMGDEWWQEVTLLMLGEAPPSVFEGFMEALLERPSWPENEQWLRMCIDEAVHASVAPFLPVLRDPCSGVRERAVILELFKHDRAVIEAVPKLLRESNLAPELDELAQQTVLEAEDRVMASAPTIAGALERANDAYDPFDVFISYHRSDKPFVHELVEHLRASGVRPWFDEYEIALGDDIGRSVKRGLAHSAAVLIALGPAGLSRGQLEDMAMALVMAAEDRKRLIPVILPAVPVGPAVDLPWMLRTRVYVDLREDAKRGMERLVSVLLPTDPEALSVRVLATNSTMTVGVDSARLNPVVFIEPLTGMRFLSVPGGTFMMGSQQDDPEAYDEERPPHEVTLSSFWLAEAPVTNAQYAQYMKAVEGVVEPRLWRNRRFSAKDQPVVGVSWHQAEAFCRWLGEVSGLGIQLPTEAQWEYAARGTDGRRYAWGNEPPDATRACYGRGVAEQPAPVGRYPHGRGPFGHLDLAGNVWEWCRDAWDGSAYHGPGVWVDPVFEHEDAITRVCRGGAWSYPTQYLRAAGRSGNDSEGRGNDIGLRVCWLPR